MTITKFLEARIAEDEKVARDRPNSAQIHYSGCYYYNYSLDANWECDCDDDGEGTRRLLAECAAKRAVIKQVSDVAWGGYAVRDVILGRLAAVYKDHTDYRQEWAV